MANDAGHSQTDAELAALEAKIKDVYLNAYADAAEGVTAYFSQFEVRDAEQRNAMYWGKITQTEYNKWRETQIARGEGYEKMRDKLAEQYTNANQVAIAYVNDATPSIYSLNRNYSAYEIEAAGANVDFSLWDAGTVRNLLVNNPDVMPNYPEQKAIDRGIDLQFGKDQIQKSVTQGILLGHSVGKIADDLQKRINSMSRTSALRAARTAFTEAECAGRQDEYELASDLGIELQKEWLSTADGLTRETHMEADGQTVGIKEAFIVGSDSLMFPADPTGSPEEVYNCRCTTVAKVKGSTNYQDAARWMKDPETGEREKVSGLTYYEWLDAKQNGLIENDPLTKYDTGNIIEPENVSAVAHIFDSLDEAQNFFYNVCGQGDWDDSLTPDERYAVERYTGNAYQWMNNALRDDSMAGLNQEDRLMMQDLHNAINKYELKESIQVERFTNYPAFKEMKVGDVYSDAGFMSTAAVGEVRMGHWQMTATIPAGTGQGAWVQPLSNFSNENEFLVQNGSVWEITAIDTVAQKVEMTLVKIEERDEW